MVNISYRLIVASLLLAPTVFAHPPELECTSKGTPDCLSALRAPASSKNGANAAKAKVPVQALNRRTNDKYVKRSLYGRSDSDADSFASDRPLLSGFENEDNDFWDIPQANRPLNLAKVSSQPPPSGPGRDTPDGGVYVDIMDEIHGTAVGQFIHEAGNLRGIDFQGSWMRAWAEADQSIRMSAATAAVLAL